MSAEPLVDVDSQRGEVTLDAHPTSGPAIAEPEQGEGQVDEQDEAGEGDDQQPQGVDPIELATMLAIGANNRLASRGVAAPSIDRQIALAQAIATVELARWTRTQAQLNAQIISRAQAAQQLAAKGPTSLVLPPRMHG